MSPWKLLLSPPEVGPTERDLLIEAFDSGWIAPAGPDLDAFEGELAAFTGAGAVAALSSGTAALHLALQVVGVRAGDDVLMPTLTFAASAFAATYLGARPCFVDVDATWHLDPSLLDAELDRRALVGVRPAAVVVVDLYGSVADLVAIREVCARHDVPLVEDAAEAIGASVGDTAAGRFGVLGVLSFNGNKMLTTGGGGALIGDDPELIARCRHLATQARQPALHYEHAEVGYNYRLGNLNAAVGRGQLRTLPDRIAARRRVRAMYEQALLPLGGISFQPPTPDSHRNHWLTTIAVDPDEFGTDAATVLAALHAERIEARPGFKPMHLQPVFADHSMISTGRANRLFDTCISLPSSGRLTSDDIGWVAATIEGARR